MVLRASLALALMLTVAALASHPLSPASVAEVQ